MDTWSVDQLLHLDDQLMEYVPIHLECEVASYYVIIDSYFWETHTGIRRKQGALDAGVSLVSEF